ncbi:MAG: hypothetical protein K5898_05925 [Ruminococcus sp.]|uniref:hypothetical protein n=1 Tax=Ruminococcus sp. TaxID=41978 RepID=UPI0025EC48D9|nr:hypothetical protein [Ruminococcus sp.]MCR4794694.1 hypothetical protein [Ruminococcus sp.]
METKKRFSILKCVIIVLCLILIVVSIIVNIMFSGGKTPKIFGNYIYVVKASDNMGNNVTEGAALIAPDAKDLSIAKGDIVLAYPAAEPEKLHVLSIYDVVTAEDGTEKYTTADASNVGSSESISKDSIVALCTGHTESKELGWFIRFASSIKGILLLLVLPCVLLVVMLIIKIASGKGDEDDDFGFYEYDEMEKQRDLSETRRNSHDKAGNPLFEPSQEIQPSSELERKKMSIAENFSQKKVNPDSPYQKEKERTMQFKTQRSAESTFAARNVGGSSSTAPTADALREEMLRKTAEAERTGTFNIKTTSTPQQPAAPAEPITDNTGILSKSQLAEMSRNDVPKTTPLRSQSAPSTAAPKPVKKSNTPDISDIISKTDHNERKKKAADMSVDDLLKLIEEEKKKL